MSKVKWTLYYKRRQEDYKEEFEDLKEVFDFVEEMENGPGGYAEQIWHGAAPQYTRYINEDAGLAYWVEFGSGNSFVEYRG